METQTIIDRDTINELKTQLGADFVVELIDTYNCDIDQLIDQMRQALAANDAVLFGRLAHTIKSSSASLGALPLSKQARELEILGKAHDLSQAGSLLERLAVNFLQVRRCLEELRGEP